MVRMFGLPSGDSNSQFIGEYQRQASAINGRAWYKSACQHSKGCRALWYGDGRWEVGTNPRQAKCGMYAARYAGAGCTCGCNHGVHHLFPRSTAENPEDITSPWHVKIGSGYQQQDMLKLHCSGACTHHPFKTAFSYARLCSSVQSCGTARPRSRKQIEDCSW